MGAILEQFDVIVVGGGIAGASVAWHLRRHARVLLLERGVSFGAEAASQNAGMIRLLAESPAERALAIRGQRWLVETARERGRIDLFRKTGGIIGFARKTDRLDDAVAHLRECGVRVSQTTSLPAALTDSPIVAAWYLPDAGVTDGHALVSLWLSEARASGVVTRRKCAVTQMHVENGAVVGVRVDDRIIRASAVVVAAGAWSSRLCPSVRLSPRSRHLLVTRRHRLSSREHPWCWIDDVGLYARPEGEGWLVSPCDQTVFVPGEDSSWGDVEPLQRAIAHEKLDEWMPALSDVHFQNGWTGVRTFSPDGDPILGADEQRPGLYWATALGGFGVTGGYAVGEYVADIILGNNPTWLDKKRVNVSRFSD